MLQIRVDFNTYAIFIFSGTLTETAIFSTPLHSTPSQNNVRAMRWGTRARLPGTSRPTSHTRPRPPAPLRSIAALNMAVLRHTVPAFFLYICVARSSTGNTPYLLCPSGHASPGHRHADHDYGDVCIDKKSETLYRGYMMSNHMECMRTCEKDTKQ